MYIEMEWLPVVKNNQESCCEVWTTNCWRYHTWTIEGDLRGSLRFTMLAKNTSIVYTPERKRQEKRRHKKDKRCKQENRDRRDNREQWYKRYRLSFDLSDRYIRRVGFPQWFQMFSRHLFFHPEPAFICKYADARIYPYGTYKKGVCICLLFNSMS